MTGASQRKRQRVAGRSWQRRVSWSSSVTLPRNNRHGQSDLTQVRLHQLDRAQRASDVRTLASGALKLAVGECTKDFAELDGACSQVRLGESARLEVHVIPRVRAGGVNQPRVRTVDTMWRRIAPPAIMEA